MKKILSVIFAVAILISAITVNGASAETTPTTISVNADESEWSGTVIADATQYSTEQRTWILTALSSDGYLLQNKATGLYLTMENIGSAEVPEYSLYQASYRGSDNNTSQTFKFLDADGSTGAKTYYLLYNVALNTVLYSTNSGEGFAFKSVSTWWEDLPAGVDNNNYGQFWLAADAIGDSKEIVIKFAGTSKYLQSETYTVPNYSDTVIADATQYSTEQRTWILTALSSGGYLLQNKATGLYLTMENIGTTEAPEYTLYQASYRGSDNNTSQTFKFFDADGAGENTYYLLYNVALNTVLYSTNSGNGFAFKSVSSWWTDLPAGVDKSNYGQFWLAADAIGDSKEIVIKFAGTSKYLQSKKYNIPEETKDIMVESQELGTTDSKWILHSVSGNDYTLENQKTGLYLTLDDRDGDADNDVYQAEKRSQNDITQVFTINEREIYEERQIYYIEHKNSSLILYKNTDNISIGLSSGEWHTLGEGLSNALCALYLECEPADGEISYLKVNNIYIQNIPDLVSISATATDGGEVSCESDEVYIGTTVTATATPKSGYLFDGWYVGDEKVCEDAKYTFVATVDVALIAKFVPNYGDADFSGTIDEADVVELRRCLLFDEAFKPQYDANIDGEMDICDLVRLAITLDN